MWTFAALRPYSTHDTLPPIHQNYVVFEEWINPILDAMLKEQQEQGTLWTPSKMIRRLGKEIDNEDSVYYWAYKVRAASVAKREIWSEWLVLVLDSTVHPRPFHLPRISRTIFQSSVRRLLTAQLAI